MNKDYYINFSSFTNKQIIIKQQKNKLAIKYIVQMYKKVIVSKEGDNPMKLHYEVGKGIDNSEYEELLNKFSPNFEFSIVDKMIQELSTDSEIIPSFKKSSLFTNEDLESIVNPFKNDYKIAIKPKIKPSKYFKSKTHKRKQNKNKNKKKQRKQTKSKKKGSKK